jgi:hypothetical protein
LFIVASKYAIIVSKSFPRKSGAALVAQSLAAAFAKVLVPAVPYTNVWQNKRRDVLCRAAFFQRI